MKEYKELRTKLKNLLSDGDQERAHIEADNILILVALNTEFTLTQRKALVLLYQQIDKWYA